MTIQEMFAREVARAGLIVTGTPRFDRYGISAVLALPDESAFVGLVIDDERSFEAGRSRALLVRHEIRALREALFIGWHFERLKRANPPLILVDLIATCPDHPDNRIVKVDRMQRTYACDGQMGRSVHGWPEHSAIIAGGGIEVVQPGGEP
jgi:hypothetical protein